jgi:hypothetical protein
MVVALARALELSQVESEVLHKRRLATGTGGWPLLGAGIDNALTTQCEAVLAQVSHDNESGALRRLLSELTRDMAICSAPPPNKWNRLLCRPTGRERRTKRTAQKARARNHVTLSSLSGMSPAGTDRSSGSLPPR